MGKQLSRRRVAFKFETGWVLGTFRGIYSGGKLEYTGFVVVHLDTKETQHLDLQINAYGSDKDWVILKELKQHKLK